MICTCVPPLVGGEIHEGSYDARCRSAVRHRFEYYRHGTLSLFAALDTRSGTVLAQTYRLLSSDVRNSPPQFSGVCYFSHVRPNKLNTCLRSPRLWLAC